MVLPSFTNVEEDDVDLGPLDNFPRATTSSRPTSPTRVRVRSAGERCSCATTARRRRACRASRSSTAGVHLGCPVQPNGPIDEEARQEVEGGVELRPVLAQSFGCPATEASTTPRATGQQPAGALAGPLHVLDRDGRLVLGELFAVGNVSGTGATATISKYPWWCRHPRRRRRGVALPDRAEPGDGVARGREFVQRKSLVETAVLAPRLDRRPHAGRQGTKWFLFRKVPRDISWAQTLGSATLTAFIVQTLTGVILAMYYQPSSAIDPITGKPIAYSSIEHITNDLTLAVARPRHAPLGRERLRDPPLPAHGPRLPLRRLQAPARADVDHRCPASSRACSWASPATCCRGTRPRTGRPSSAST